MRSSSHTNQRHPHREHCCNIMSRARFDYFAWREHAKCTCVLDTRHAVLHSVCKRCHVMRCCIHASSPIFVACSKNKCTSCQSVALRVHNRLPEISGPHQLNYVLNKSTLVVFSRALLEPRVQVLLSESKQNNMCCVCLSRFYSDCFLFDLQLVYDSCVL